MIFEHFILINRRGHSPDGLSIYDSKTKALISGDALQQHGIGRYRNGISDAKEYLCDIERLKTMDIETVISSHDYDPLGYLIKGAEKISELYEICAEVT